MPFAPHPSLGQLQVSVDDAPSAVALVRRAIKEGQAVPCDGDPAQVWSPFARRRLERPRHRCRWRSIRCSQRARGSRQARAARLLTASGTLSGYRS